MALFRRTPARDVVIIFDIGSSSVGGAVVEYNEDETPTILFSTRRAIQFKKEFDFDSFFSSMVRTFETVTMEVLTSLAQAVEDVTETIQDSKKRVLGKRRIGDAYCVFGSPWYQAHILSFEETFKRPTMITENEVVSIAKKAGDELRSSFEDPESAGLLENSILDYTLNGYRVSHEQSMKARTVGVSVYASSISKDTVSAVKKPIRRGLNTRGINSYSFLMAFFTVMRDLYPHKGNFATVDTRGEVTEVGIVKDDALIHTFTFPFGRNTLARGIVNAFGGELFEAHSRLALYADDKVDEQERVRIESALEQERKQFIESLMSALSEVPILPKTFYMLSDRDTEGWFFSALEEGLATQNGSREVRALNEDTLGKFLEVVKSRYRDHFLILDSLFISRVRRGEV